MRRQLLIFLPVLLMLSLLAMASPSPVHFNPSVKYPRRFQEAADSTHPSGRAYRLESYKDDTGKFIKGAVSSTVISLQPGKDLVVDYDFKAESPDARYGLLAVGSDSRTRLLTLVIQKDRFQLLGAGKRILDAGKFVPGRYRKFRYVFHPERNTLDIYLDDMQKPVISEEAFRDGKSVSGIRLTSLGSPYVESRSWFADVKYSFLTPAPAAAPKKTVLPPIPSALPGRAVIFNMPRRNPRCFQEISDSTHPSGKACRLESYKDDTGKFIKGSVSSTVISLQPGKDLVVDYDFKAESPDARYGLLAVGSDSRTRLLTLVIQKDRFQLLGAGKRILDAGKFVPGKYRKFRYVFHPERNTLDIYLDDMQKPVISEEAFRNGKSVSGIRLTSLGSPYVESRSWFADVKYSFVPPAPAAAPKKTVLPPIPSALPGRAVIFNMPRRNPRCFQEAADSTHPSGRAYRLESYKDEDGKFIKGAVSSTVITLDGYDKIVIDYDFKAISPASRYAMLLTGSDSRIRLLTMVVTGDRFQVLGSERSFADAGKVRFGEYQHIRYVVHPLTARFDVFIDDMDRPAVANQEFRDRRSVPSIRLFSLSHPTAESVTCFADVRYSLSSPKSFPSETLGRAPFFIAGAGVIQGQPEEKDWSSAPEYSLTPAAESKNITACRILRNKDWLFLRYDCRTEKFQLPPKSGRDGRLWLNDCLEIFITADPLRKEYFHFVGNAAGEMYDARCSAAPRQRHPEWDGKWTLQSRRTPKGWQADIAVAFSNFGSRPAEGAVFFLNLCRENPGERELFSWSSSGDFHNPQSWGKLFFFSGNPSRPAYAPLLQNYFHNDRLHSEVKNLLSEIRKNFSTAELGNSLTDCETALRKAAELYEPQTQDFFSQYAWNRALTENRVKLLRKFDHLKQRKGIFAPGTEAAQKGFVLKAHTFMTKISPDYFSGEGNDDLRLMLAGGEYGGGQISLLLKSELPKGAKISIAVPDLPDYLKLQTYRMLPVVSTARWRAPRTYFDIMQPGSSFTTDGGHLLAFAVDFQVLRGTPARQFQGRILLSLPGRSPLAVPLQIRTTGFDLPAARSLDTAFCFHDAWVTEFYGRPMSLAQKKNFLRFISDHHLEPMDLWSREPDVGDSVLDYCQKELGKQLLFLKIDRIDESRKMIEKYRGRLHPILFGHDEVLDNPSKIGAMQRSFLRASRELPGIDRLNTARIDRRLENYVNIWCPRFHEFNISDAHARQALGEKVWWYATDYPLQPFPNFNLDSPGVDTRIIPWMNWKIGITGLLYWALNREWSTNATDGRYLTEEELRQRGITWLTPEIRRKMNAGTIRFPAIPWLSYFRSISSKATSREAGAGNLIYPGPDFTPWPSLRLKNLRDGLQDYEYFVILRNETRRLGAARPGCPILKTARNALAVSPAIVVSPTEYTKNPQDILRAKEKLAELINQTRKDLK